MLIPAVLVPDMARGIPARAVHQPHREIGHGRSVLAITGIQPASVMLHDRYLNVWCAVAGVVTPR